MNFFQAYGRYFDYLSGGSGGGGVSVVELSTVITDTDFPALTETESAALDAAIASGKPIYLKGQYSIGGGNQTNFDMFPMVVRYPDYDSYAMQYSMWHGLSSATIYIAKEEGAWMCGALVFDFSSLTSTTENTET